MAKLSVENLSKVVGTPVDKLLEQLKEAGMEHKGAADEVTDEDKKKLLEFLKSQQSKKTKTISLKRKTPPEDKSSSSIEIRRKRPVTKSNLEGSATTKPSDEKVFDFDEIERKRQQGEETKKSEELRRKKEVAEKRTQVVRKSAAKTKTSAGPSNLKSKPEKIKKAPEKKPVLSKKEQKELEGEEFLSKQQSQHAFEKPSEFIAKDIKIPETLTVNELASSLSLKSSEVLKKLMEMGVMANLNQTLDQDTAILVTEELGHKAEPAVEELAEDKLDELVSYEGEQESRHPVVSVLGHVDHGKTTLLDFIRSANVAGIEEGGITQKIGAYQALTSQGAITFIDTPGHAAFSEVRARGANSTDIVILVVAADDGLQPQTEEAISHTKAAGVPVVVAINKMDTEGADPEKVKSELSAKEIVPEDWGGDTQCVEISALKGDGVEDLLEAVSLQAEVLDLKAFFKGPAHGVVLDSSIEKGQGAVATVLVKEGTLKLSDYVLIGEQTKRIRSLLDENGKQLKEAGPSFPVLISGLDTPPKAGEEFVVVENEKMAKEISNERAKKSRETRLARQQITNLENLFDSELSNHTLINLLIKADTHGSLEAIIGSLKNFESEEVKINIVHDAVGAINVNDINLALTTGAMVVGFNVRADNPAKGLAESESIDISYHGIIYDLIDGIKDIIEGSLEPDIKEEVLGTAEVKDTFKSPKFGLIAGSMVIEGTIKRNKFVRVIRDNIVIFEGVLDSLRRFKDEASEVATGTECGIGIANYTDVKVGDKIEVFDKKEVRKSI